MSKALIHALVLVGVMNAGGAQAISIDGNLADWGVQRNGTAADWIVGSAAKAASIEDTHDSFLSPGYGGQLYDAEAMYVTWDSQNMYLALATGHNPLTANNPGANQYAAGDIAIDFGVNGTYEYGVELLGGGTTTKGHVYSNVNWAVGIWKPNGSWTGYADPATAGNIALADTTHPTSILSGTDVGTGSVAYTTSGANNYGAWPSDLHYFYEVSVPLSVFAENWANGNNFRVHWTQNCANDSISASATILGAPLPDTPNPVPEPGTLFLLPLGLAGLIALRRKTANQ